MSYPFLKIGLLLMKQISKPIATYIKNQTKEHPKFKSLLRSFAQSYHNFETKMIRRQAEISGPSGNIRPLDDKKAIDLAANFIGETLIFTVAVSALMIESVRKKHDDNAKAAIIEARFKKLEDEIKYLQINVGTNQEVHSSHSQVTDDIQKSKPFSVIRFIKNIFGNDSE